MPPYVNVFYKVEENSNEIKMFFSTTKEEKYSLFIYHHNNFQNKAFIYKMFYDNREIEKQAKTLDQYIVIEDCFDNDTVTIEVWQGNKIIAGGLYVINTLENIRKGILFEITVKNLAVIQSLQNDEYDDVIDDNDGSHLSFQELNELEEELSIKKIDRFDYLTSND